MFIDPDWRILTVGDGDLSFSNALHTQHHPRLLEASVYDSEPDLLKKYSHNELHLLRSHGIRVHTGLDITNPLSSSRVQKKFDVIIFQFPLIARFPSKKEFEVFGQHTCSNTLNRRLLRLFLIHSFRYLLAENGKQLCFITSKDVKPYCEWNLEESLNRGLDVPYLGSMRFELKNFPGYRIRNVERDTIIADTKGTTYVWGQNLPSEMKNRVSRSPYLGPDCCGMCRAGPFVADEDRLKHLRSKKHLRMQSFEDKWTGEIAILDAPLL